MNRQFVAYERYILISKISGRGSDSITLNVETDSTLIATMSRLTSLTSLWQDSTLLVSSCSCVRISQRATVVSSWRSPRCSSSSLALKFILITLTCFCRLPTHTYPHVNLAGSPGKINRHCRAH